MTISSGREATAGSGRFRSAADPARRGLAVRDAGALIFAADMYGVQLDQLAALTGERADGAGGGGPLAFARLRGKRPRLTPGPPGSG